MILIYSANPESLATYTEILDNFPVEATTDKSAFIKDLSKAELIIIDNDSDLLAQSIQQTQPAGILFIGQIEPTQNIIFLKKPLSSSVFIRRVELMWQRIQKGLQINFTTPHYDFNGSNKTLNGIALTPKEAELIEYLWENKDKVVGKDELLKEIFGYKDGVETHTLETHIYKLRQKINAAQEELILTRDGGYQLNLK